MERNILIAGKETPSINEFAETFATSEDTKITIAGQSQTTSQFSSSIKEIPWNKSTALSARSFILQAETLNNTTTDAILYFDTQYFSSKFSSLTTDSCAPACDQMILGFQYLTLELIKRIEQHQTKCKIIFLLKNSPSLYDLEKSGTKNPVSNIANPLVSSAEAAFANFAQNIAAQLIKNEFAQVLLISADAQNETAQNDSTFASWLRNYLDSFDSKKSNNKNISWIKAGSKATGFSLFH